MSLGRISNIHLHEVDREVEIVQISLKCFSEWRNVVQTCGTARMEKDVEILARSPHRLQAIL
eukprot:764621-Hanusia_phi.AAC.3